MADLLPDDVAHDREIRFDAPISFLAPRKGEYEIDAINAVEDTKGNNGEKGQLSVTNLRVIWIAHRDARTNLSIGLSCVQSTSIRSAQSRLRGSTQALYVMTKYNSSRFEFIFTSLVKNSPRLFTTVQAVVRAYETSKLYRDLKLRGAIIKDKQLIMLPDESLYSQVDGVWNLSSDQGNLGFFFITSIRLVWHASLAENFNVSIPYLQIKSLKIRDSKFGHALVIETTSRSGAYVLGFRMDPLERLQQVYQQISRLHEIFSAEPNFGVKFEVQEKAVGVNPLEHKVQQKQEDIEIVHDASHFDALASYYAERDKSSDHEPVYNPELGLAIEKLKDGVTVDSLWSVVQN